jgi:hypothetical protein
LGGGPRFPFVVEFGCAAIACSLIAPAPMLMLAPAHLRSASASSLNQYRIYVLQPPWSGSQPG